MISPHCFNFLPHFIYTHKALIALGLWIVLLTFINYVKFIANSAFNSEVTNQEDNIGQEGTFSNLRTYTGQSTGSHVSATMPSSSGGIGGEGGGGGGGNDPSSRALIIISDVNRAYLHRLEFYLELCV